MNDALSVDQKEKTAQFIWTGIILSFFMIQAVIWAVAIAITSNDPSHAIVANYDEKALNWDDFRAMKHASESLGWRSTIQVDQAADLRGNRVVTLSLTDRDSAPVADALITIQAFHRGRAKDVQELDMNQVAPGVYAGIVRVQRAGQWVFSGKAVFKDKTFILDQRQFITLPGR